MSELRFRFLLAGAARGQRFPHRLRLRLRRRLVRKRNPPGRWELGARRREIPLILAELPQWCGFIVRVSEFPGLRVARFSAVDVGAKIGDTARMLRAGLPCPVLWIEGDAGFTSPPRRNVGGLDGVEVVEVLPREKTDQVRARMVVAGGSSTVTTNTQAPALAFEYDPYHLVRSGEDGRAILPPLRRRGFAFASAPVLPT